MLVRTVTCLEGRVEVELVCEPVFDYGRTPAEWTLVDGGRHAADASGADVTIRLRTDLALGIEGDRVRARHALGRRARLLLALVGGGLGVARRRRRRAARLDATTVRYWRRWLGRARLADHRWRPTRSSARPSRSRA